MDVRALLAPVLPRLAQPQVPLAPFQPTARWLADSVDSAFGASTKSPNVYKGFKRLPATTTS